MLELELLIIFRVVMMWIVRGLVLFKFFGEILELGILEI